MKLTLVNLWLEKGVNKCYNSVHEGHHSCCTQWTFCDCSIIFWSVVLSKKKRIRYPNCRSFLCRVEQKDCFTSFTCNVLIYSPLCHLFSSLHGMVEPSRLTCICGLDNSCLNQKPCDCPMNWILFLSDYLWPLGLSLKFQNSQKTIIPKMIVPLKT